MKNLRKVLALVLVVASLMSVMAMASAVDFADKDEIVSKEAVTVLAEMGIIAGKPQGDKVVYDGNGLVTRGEMAKLIAVVLNKGEDVGEKYVAGNTFADVVGHWAAGYIAYGVAEGIIAGYPDGSFKANNNVKVVEVAKMLLCALGYDEVASGFTGTDNWATNITREALAKNLYKGVSQGSTEAATRNTAAQMVLNALEATMVEVTGGSNVTINGMTIVTGSKTEDKKVILAGEEEEVAYNGTEDGYVQMIEALFPDVTKTTSGNDGYGRFSTTWKIGTKTVYQAALKAKATYKVAVTQGNVWAAMGNKAPKSVVIWEDGKDATETYASMITTLKALTKTNSKYAFGGQGTVAELYVSGTKLNVVLTNTYVGKIAKVAAKGEVTQLNGEAKLTNVNTASYKKGDVVLYTLKNGKVDTLAKAEMVTGKNKGYKNDYEELYLGDKAYVLNANAVGYSDFNKLGYDAGYNFYLDAEGNAIYVAAVEKDKVTYKYAYLVAKAEDKAESDSLFEEDGAIGEITYYARLLKTDGTKQDVVLNIKANAFEALAVNEIYAYTEKDGKVTLTQDEDAGTFHNDNTATTVTLANKGASFETSNGIYDVNLETVFVVETLNNKNEKVYDVYTGIVELPNLETDSIYMTEKEGIVNLVYVFDANIIEEDPEIEITHSIVLTSENDTFVTTKETIYTVTAMVQGVVKELQVNEATYNKLVAAGTAAGDVKWTLVESFTETKGVVTGVDLDVANTNEIEISAAYKAGAIETTRGREFIEADVVAYVYDTEAEELTVTTVSELTKAFEGVVLVDEESAIVAFFGADAL